LVSLRSNVDLDAVGPYETGLLGAPPPENADGMRFRGARDQCPQVAEWEAEFNGLVYEVCGLTEEEIALVEGWNH
jgi:hypothetical protein